MAAAVWTWPLKSAKFFKIQEFSKVSALVCVPRTVSAQVNVPYTVTGGALLRMFAC